jgi:hypothetical protein
VIWSTTSRARFVAVRKRRALIFFLPLAGLLLGGFSPSGTAFARGGALKPKLGVSVVVARVAGTVRVQPRGARRFVLLRDARLISVGSTVDAADGRVHLITARDARGSTQNGVFYGGAFVVTQKRAAPGLTDLRLVGGSATVCGQGAKGALRAGARQSRRAIRRLHGQAHGRFLTRGRYSAATIRGTVWLTEDTCDGTLIRDSKGTVDTVSGGGQGFRLKPGQSAIYYCFPPERAFHRPDYCLTILSIPASGLFIFALGTRAAVQNYGLCVRAPSGAERCQQFPLTEPIYGVRISAVGCLQDEGPGAYIARWLIAGQPLGLPLPFTATIPRPAQPRCTHSP